jgi:hypothetical protein
METTDKVRDLKPLSPWSSPPILKMPRFIWLYIKDLTEIPANQMRVSSQEPKQRKY